MGARGGGVPHRIRPGRLERPVDVVRLGQTPLVAQRGVPLLLDVGVARVAGLQQPDRRGQEGLGRGVVGDQPGRGRRAAQQRRHGPPLARLGHAVQGGEVLLRSGGRVLGLGGQPPGHRQLQRGPSVRVHPGVRGLLHPVVPEARRRAAVVVHHDQAVVHRRHQSGVDLVRRPAGCRAQQVETDVAAQARHHLEQFPRAGRQRLDPGPEQVHDVAAADEPAQRRRIPPPALAVGHQRTLAPQRVQQLHGVEGVPAGARREDLGERRRLPGRYPQHRGEQRAQVAGRQVGQA